MMVQKISMSSQNGQKAKAKLDVEIMMLLTVTDKRKLLIEWKQ